MDRSPLVVGEGSPSFKLSVVFEEAVTLAGPAVSLRMLVWEPAQEGLTILSEWVFGSQGETGVLRRGDATQGRFEDRRPRHCCRVQTLEESRSDSVWVEVVSCFSACLRDSGPSG